MSLTKVSYSMINGAVVNVLDFGATGNGTTNDTTAIQNAIDSVNVTGKGGVVYFPPGRYVCNDMLKVPWTGAAVTLRGAGSIDQTGTGGTSVIVGAHNKDAILNLQGSVGCQLIDIAFQGDLTATFPKTGIIQGRNGPGSAGWHTFERIYVTGNFSIAALYNVASEGNTYKDCFFYVGSGGTATKTVYLSGGDGGGLSPVTALTGSTLLGAEFVNCQFYTEVATAGVSCVFIDGSISVGAISFHNGYLVQKNGHFVEIRNGIIDGKDTFGGISFIGMGAEVPGGVGTPLSGFYLHSQAGADGTILQGLSIISCNFHMKSGYFIKQDQYVVLRNATILSSNGFDDTTGTVVARPSLFKNAYSSPILRYGSSTVAPGECLNCLIDVGNGLAPTGANFSVELLPLTLINSWSTTYGVANGFGNAGWWKDAYNVVHLTGAVGGGTSGTVCSQLPVGCRPAYNQSFAVNTSGGFGTVTIDASGNITPTGTTVTPVYLTGITFPAV
jgi:hypothetical protein